MYSIIREFFELFVRLHAFEHWVSERFDVVWEKRRRSTFGPTFSRFSFLGPRNRAYNKPIRGETKSRQRRGRKSFSHVAANRLFSPFLVFENPADTDHYYYYYYRPVPMFFVVAAAIVVVVRFAYSGIVVSEFAPRPNFPLVLTVRAFRQRSQLRGNDRFPGLGARRGCFLRLLVRSISNNEIKHERVVIYRRTLFDINIKFKYTHIYICVSCCVLKSRIRTTRKNMRDNHRTWRLDRRVCCNQ